MGQLGIHPDKPGYGKRQRRVNAPPRELEPRDGRGDQDGEILVTFTGDGGLGEEVAAVGDLDGDGLPEILAGAPDRGYALVVSFGQKPDPPALSIHRDHGQVILWGCPQDR